MNDTQNNIDKLTQLVKARLNSTSKVKSVDLNGDVGYVEIDIFSQEQMTNFLTISLSEFNQTPKFTNFTFEDADIIAIFADVLVEGAVVQALGSHALLERGREISCEVFAGAAPCNKVSDLLNDQYRILLDYHERKLRNIKLDIQSLPSMVERSGGMLFTENGCLKWRTPTGGITTIGVCP